MSFRVKLITGFALVFLFGCEAKKEEAKLAGPSAGPTLSQAAQSLLMEADKLDGNTDQVIGKCYVCGLGMNGSDKYVVKVQGYTAHLCSAGCQHEFETSTEKIVLETKIPKAKE